MSDQNSEVTSEEIANPELMELAGTLEASEVAEVENAIPQEVIDAKQAAIEAGAVLVKKGLQAAVALGSAKYPALPEIWTESVMDNTANAAAAVLVKYDVSTPEFMGKYAEEINLALTMAPPLFATWFMMKAQQEAQAEKRREKARLASMPPAEGEQVKGQGFEV